MSNAHAYEDDDHVYEDTQQALAPIAGSDGALLSAHDARPVPRISIQAFCDTEDTAETVQMAAEDRRLSKAHVSVHMGGAAAAVAHYETSPTPNLIILEATGSRDDVINQIDALAECCDVGTKVVIIGHVNDVILYRELIRRGVSEYLVSPVSPIMLMEGISNLYNDPDSDPVGNVIAFIGAKGGVGSSTICHNVAWTISELLTSDVVVADFDLAFGTTGLDFNQDPVQGIAEALQSPERLDEVLLDRLLTKCTEHLSIFAAPVILDRDYDMSPEACETVVDVVRQNVPYVVVDLPHLWTDWNKQLLMQADEIVITATPDLANLRNTKNIIELVKTMRASDGPPHLVLNMIDMPKRPEIPVREFCQGLDVEPTVMIEFDSETFGHAANNGQMLEELSAKSPIVESIHDLSLILTHRQEFKPQAKAQKKSGGGLAPLLEKLSLKR
ncbi:MAG: AAA family ATPase [Pseudomonadota bacterium]